VKKLFWTEQDKATGEYAPQFYHKKALALLIKNKDNPFLHLLPPLSCRMQNLCNTSPIWDKLKGTLEPESPHIKGLMTGSQI